MQGDVLAPLMSSLQVDTMGKECLEEVKHLYYYKGTVPIPPLGMVDDLFTISTCGFRTTMVNEYINFKTAMKKTSTRGYNTPVPVKGTVKIVVKLFHFLHKCIFNKFFV